MKIFLCLFLFASSIHFVSAQTNKQMMNVAALQPEGEITDVYAKKIYSDSLATTFVIWVETRVPLHQHEWHTEQVLVLEGTAEMIVGNTTIQIEKGDIVFIPEGTAHSVTVTSEIPLKVVSIQSPEFLGNDRVILEE